MTRRATQAGRRRRIAATMAAVVLLPLAPAAAAPPASATEQAEVEETTIVAVDVDQDASDQSVDELTAAAAEVAEQAGGAMRVDSPESDLVSVEVPSDTAEEVIAALDVEPASARIDEPAEFSLFRAPRDPRFAGQRPYLRAVGVPKAWNFSRGSRDVTIAVVDSGVAVNHPDLRGKVRLRHNAVNGGRSVTDRDGHGTAVASVAAASTSNRLGIAGVGWRTSLMAVKVADRDGRIWGDALAAGIRWAARSGADVINLSLGSPVDDVFVRKAIAYAVKRGVIVVASVSNSGSTSPIYPAAYPGVLSVGATEGRRLADFSDRGPLVDVSAPGTRLVSARPGGYTRVDGTSFSAAIVSGQAALIRAERPRIRASRVSRIIVRTARPVGEGDSATRRVNVADSVVRAMGVPTAPLDVTTKPRARAVVVRWDPPAVEGRKPLTRYRVDVRAPGSRWRTAGRVDDRRQRFVVRGLKPGRDYSVRVVAVNRLGSGVPSVRADVTTR